MENMRHRHNAGVDSRTNTPGGVPRIRKELTAVYEQYAPAKLESGDVVVDELLAKYAGREGLLLKKVKAKYAPPENKKCV